MVVFSGDISFNVVKKTRDLRAKHSANIAIIALLLADIFVCIPVCGVIPEIREVLFYNIIILCLILILRFIPANAHPLVRFNYHITINNEEIVCADNVSKKTRKKQLKQIRKVIDAGECYYVIYKWGEITNCIICQKDLIREGTIEEFEELFKGKIVKEKEKKVFKRKNK